MIHKLIVLVLTGSFVFTACNNDTRKEEDKTKTSENKVVEEVKTPEAKIYFSSETVRPGNMAITSSNRMFVTENPLMSPKSKIYEIKANGEAIPYPNDKYVTGDNSVIKAVIGIRADSKDNLWFLDMETKQFVLCKALS